MNTNFFKLEYDKILNILITYCKTSVGKNYVLKLRPSFNNDKVKLQLQQTNESLNILIKKGTPPINELPDILVAIKSLKNKNTISIINLLNINKILRNSRELKDFFKNDIDTNEYPLLNNIFSILYSNISIENTISKVIIDENTIADNASKKLFNIRKEKNRINNTIKDKLNNYIHSSKYLMEPIITIRNDRYVIPVKNEYRSYIKGFIHDISSKGSTVFIEPLEIFELNNTLNNLKMEESIEIESILKNLSSLLFDYTKELEETFYNIGKLDFLFAKAKYSKELNGIFPIINSKKEFNLLEARHPLIDSNSVVPIDISLGIDYKSLVITGPNTGGKTVALKTVGLIHLMAYSGIFIPAKENSSIYIFDNIFADIGDEQSIQESLSTFSSHMLNIISIYNLATKNSLILLDELGSGTDPIEGANLAISILEYFNSIDALTISTTHYSEIKKFALINKNFKNASFEFNISDLKPTYKLLIGIPGNSYALSICEKLGMNKNIIEHAKLKQSENDTNFENIISQITTDKLIIEKEKNQITKSLNQIKSLKSKLEIDIKKQEEIKNDIIQKAKNEARNILDKAKEESDYIIKELSNNSIDLKKANNLRNSLNKSIKLTNQNENTLSKDYKPLLIEDIQIGLPVYIVSLKQSGKIISMPNKSNKVQVELNGGIKTFVKLDNLSPFIDNEESKKSYSNISNKVSLKSKNISPEINVIGQTVDEAIFIIDKYLDDCSISNLSSIRIIHGKGTGKLRQGIHNFLKTNPHVKDFRIGTFGEGEMGATIVTLKK